MNKETNKTYVNDEIQLEDILRVIYKYRIMIIIITILFTALSGYKAYKKPIYYRNQVEFKNNATYMIEYGQNFEKLISLDSFNKKLMEKSKAKEAYAKANNIKDANSIKDDVVIRWMNSLLQIKSVKEYYSAEESQIYNITVAVSAKDKEFTNAIVDEYYNILKDTYDEQRKEYIEKKMKYLEEKAKVLGDRKNLQQNMQTEDSIKTVYSYELTLSEIAEIKLQDKDFRYPLTLSKKSTGALVAEPNSSKKLMVMGFGGGLVFGLLLAFLIDLTKRMDWEKIKK